MGILKCTIGGTDVSAYLKRLTVSPGGDGRVGSASLTLTKQAAGLDIRAMHVVQVWESFDGAGNGVATRGRLFGGLVRGRDTSNMGTTQEWTLSCDDFNLIGMPRGTYRDMQAAKAVTLTAGTFAAQVTQLTQIIQQNGTGSVNTAINTTDAVQNLYGSMPAVTWEGGHGLFWYLGQLCAKAVSLSTALRPTFFISTGITVGGSEVFGPPTLYLYDKAAPPSAAFIFTDVLPTPGGQYPLYDRFKRKSASNEIVQRVQIQTPTQVLTGANNAAALSYPNPYINHGVATNKGYWMGEPLSVQTADNTAAQALIDRKVESAGYPRDSYEIVTDQRLRVGEYVSVTWALEGMSTVLLQVVETQYEIDVLMSEVWCTATLNARRLRLGQSAEDDIYAPPPLGDRVPPLPPASITKLSEIWDEARSLVRTVLSVAPSPSPDTVSYIATITEDGGEARTETITDITAWVIYVHASAACIVRVWAIDSSGNRSVDYTELTWTAIQATTIGLRNPGFDYVSHVDTTLPIYWSRAVTGGGTADRITTSYVGTGAARLLTTVTNPSSASLESDPFIPVGKRTETLVLACVATGSSVGVPLGWTVTFLDAAGSVIGTPATGTFPLTLNWAPYSTTVPAPVSTAYASAKVKFRLATTGISHEAWIDSVAFGNQTSSDDIQSDAITSAKIASGAVGTSEIADTAVDGTKLATDAVDTIHIRDAAIDGGKLATTVTLTDQTIALTSTSKITGGSYAEMGPGGIRVGGSASGAGNIDLYNQASQKIGSIYSTGASGAGDVHIRLSETGITSSLNLTAGEACTITTQDVLAAGTAVFDSTGILITTAAAYPIRFGGGSVVTKTGALSTSATDGFLYIPTCAGVPTGTPTTQTGTRAMVFDTVNSNLYIYNAGWKKVGFA